MIKRDGRVVPLDESRIERAVTYAMRETGQYDEKKLRAVVRRVLRVLREEFSPEKPPHVEQIQDIIEYALVKEGLFQTAKAFILYRRERERIRREKMAILGKEYADEVDKRLSLNAVRLLAARYLLKDEEGRLIEDPKGMFVRVASLVVIPDLLYDPRVFDKEGGQPVHPREDFDPSEWAGRVGLSPGELEGPEFTWNEHHLERMKSLYDELNRQGKMRVSWSEFWEMLTSGELDDHYRDFLEYYRLMAELRFLPNSPTLFNAGTRLGQLSACFVLRMEDSLDSIMRAAVDAATIFQSGGGIGINYSELRPEGDVVRSTNGRASGPVSFMRIIDVVTDVVKQGGRRRGANMGILEIWHPDVWKFVECKSKPGRYENFNISVMVTGDFWESYESGEPYPLRNPRTGEVWSTANPRELFRKIAEMAWKTGDPGVLFADNINRRNVLREALGEIRSTNPCGEEPLYPYESCNLGSVNLYAYVRKEKWEEGASFDWEAFSRDVRRALRFLDNVIDVNKFPLPQIEKRTKATRKVGLGLMGLADVLFALDIPYNGEEGFEFMSRVAERLTFHAMVESVQLARERGPFPLYERSAYVRGEMPVEGYYQPERWSVDWSSLAAAVRKYGIRNAEVTTIAPTGSISMIADVSSGIEPQFALVYEKRVTVGQFFYVDREFERRLRIRGLHGERILKEVADNGGSVQGLEDVPEDMRRVFLVAYDIPWWDHVRAQGEITRWICAAVSKTINMPGWVTVDDVERAYLFAHRLGLKGITIYRDGSKAVQVLVTPSQKRGEYVLKVENGTLDLMRSLGVEPPAPAGAGEAAGVGSRGVGPAGAGVGAGGGGGPEPGGTPAVILRPPPVPRPNHAQVCPECGSERLVFHENCVTCLDCGWSACTVG